MKAVFIVYNEAHKESVIEALEKSFIRGYTMWEQVVGKGSNDGEPHLGTHAWPTKNSALITFIADDLLSRLLERVEELNLQKPQLGLRTFSWNIDG
jgi:predicted NAD/FAD-dependent oxidoreductase